MASPKGEVVPASSLSGGVLNVPSEDEMVALFDGKSLQQRAIYAASLCTVDVEKISSLDESQIKLYNERWGMYVSKLLELCGVTCKDANCASPDLVVKVVESLVYTIKAMTFEERVKRTMLASHLKILLRQLPIDGPHCYYHPIIESSLLAPLDLLEGEYWKFLTSRKVSQLIYEIEEYRRSEANKEEKYKQTDDNEEAKPEGAEPEKEEKEKKEKEEWGKRRREEEIDMEARGLVLGLLRMASSYPSRAAVSLSNISLLILHFPELTKWLICLESTDDILSTLVYQAGLQGLLDSYACFTTKRELRMVVSFFQRVIAGSPSYNQVPHDKELRSLTVTITDIMRMISNSLTTVRGRMKFPSVYMVREMIKMFEDAANGVVEPQLLRATSSTPSSPWISSIWKLTPFAQAEDEPTKSGEDSEDNAFTTLRLSLGFEMLKQIPGRVVEACPEKICHILDSFLTTHCFEKSFAVICDIFQNIHTHLSQCKFSINTFVEAIVDLNLANTILLGDKPKIEGEEEDDELDGPVIPVATEEVSEDEVESDNSESGNLSGEEGYEPDREEDISRDDDPKTPESKEETPIKEIVSIPDKFGDRYVNYSMLIALKLLRGNAGFMIDCFSCFQKLSYWGISVSITNATVEGINFKELLVELFKQCVQAYMIDSNSNTIYSPPIEWTLNYVDGLINDENIKYKHTYARKLNTTELHNMNCVMALQIINMTTETLDNHIKQMIPGDEEGEKERSESYVWIRQLLVRVEKLAMDADPAIRKKARKINIAEIQQTPKIQVESDSEGEAEDEDEDGDEDEGH